VFLPNAVDSEINCLRVRIQSLAAGGAGVAKDEDGVVFIDGTAPGDVVDVELGKRRAGANRGNLLKVIERSPDRVDPPCRYAETCGGCPWMHLSAQAQLRAKESIFYDTLARLGGVSVEGDARQPILAATQTLHYRRRVRLQVRGRAVGFMGRRTHRLVDIEHCVALVPPLDKAVEAIRNDLKRQGAIPSLEQVGLLAGAKDLSASFHFVRRPTGSAIGRVRSFGFPAMAVTGDHEVARFGEPTLRIGVSGGVPLYGRPDLFVQVHEEQNDRLATYVTSQIIPGKPCLELFSGAGNFTAGLAGRASEVVSVEESVSAVELARRSAREGHLLNVRFVAGDAVAMGRSLVREGRFATIALDPPRQGASGVEELASTPGVERVVYVSCDPATLARDAKALAHRGFRVSAALPVEMFPQTYHVEGVATFDKVGSRRFDLGNCR
jgi:23S rRNA (uracil1939-C5)-methyltransferase